MGFREFMDDLLGHRHHAAVPALHLPAPEPRPTNAAGKPAQSRALRDVSPLSKPKRADHDPSWFGARMVASSSRSNGLTPANLANFLRSGIDGDPRAQSELLMEIEDKSAHLVGILGTRRGAVAQLPVRVLPASETAADRRIAAFVEEGLSDIRSFGDSLFDLLGSIYYGFGACEIDWDSRAGRVGVNELVHRPANWFTLDPQRPDVWCIVTDKDPVSGDPLAPNAWVFHQARAKSGYHAAHRGLGRPIAWTWLFGNYTLKDWLTFAELYGAPIRVGKYRPGTSEDDQATLFAALQALGTSAAAMIPEGSAIEFVQAQSTRSSVEVYEKLVTWSERAQSKCVLGQTLTTEEGARGTQALGKVHDEVRQDLIRSDARQLADTLGRDLIRPWVNFQFGPQRRYPRVEFEVVRAEHLTAQAGLYKGLVDLGMEIPRAWLHTQMRVPQPEEGEAVYGGVKTPPTPTPAPKPTPRRTPLADRRPVPEALRGPVCRTCAELPLAELPPVTAELERLIRRAITEGGGASWQGVMATLREQLLSVGRVEDALEQLVVACKQMKLDAWTDELGAALFTADLVGRAQVENGDVPLNTWPRVKPAEAVEFWTRRTAMIRADFDRLGEEHRSRAFTVTRWSTLRAVETAHDAIRNSLDNGETFSQFEDRLMQAWEWEGMNTSPQYLRVVYHNGMTTAYNAGRYAQQTRPETLSARPYWRYLAIVDERTRLPHELMNGRVWAADDPIWQVWYPPNGHFCRCRVQALSWDEMQELGLVLETEPPAWKVPVGDGQNVEEPLLPEEGWRRNAALAPPEFDFSRFSPAWRKALGVNVEES